GALIAFPLLPRGWRLAAIVAIGAVLAVFAALRLLERHQQRGQEEAARAALARQKERWAREDPAG
ncbi:MAG TPA: hypothetical protein VFX98_05290, partial [Longimicrobiaceae bacterium]|nr:hypothetical protein [Longimicrobiaceae bacterium]